MGKAEYERRILELEVELDVTKKHLESALEIVADKHELRNEISELKSEIKKAKEKTLKVKATKIKDNLFNLLKRKK